MINRVISYFSKRKLLLIVIIIASLFRLIGFYPGYTKWHSDEGFAYSSAIMMIKSLSIDPARYDYPSMVAVIHAIIYFFIFTPIFILYSFIFAPENLPPFKNLLDFWQRVPLQNQQTQVLYWGRFLTAITGIGVVFMVYKVCEKYFKDLKIGLAAAFLTAVNYRQIMNSHFGLPDIYNAFFLLLFFYTLSFILEKPTRKNYLLVGLSLAAYFSVKFQTFPILTFLLVHVYIIWTRNFKFGWLEFIKQLININLVLSLLIIPVVFVLINPYHLINFKEFVDVNKYTSIKYSFGIKSFNFYPYSYLFHVGIGKIISICVLFGIILGLRKYTLPSLIFLSYIIPFFYIFTYYSRGGFYTRNFVTITPVLLIFATIFIVRITSYLSTRFNFKGAASILLMFLFLFLVSFNQIGNSLINSYYNTQPHGYELANKWATEIIPDGVKIVTHPWDQYPQTKHLEVIPFERDIVYSLAEMREEGAEYGFLGMDWIVAPFYWWMARSTADSLMFWEKPDNISSNMFSAVSAQELASWSVAHFVKPWQAPDANFLIVKIPKEITIKDKKTIARYTFDDPDSLKNWSLIYGRDGETDNIIWDGEVGNINLGSLKIAKGGGYFPVTRAVSPVIQIEENKAVHVIGNLKTGVSLVKEKRDGMLRVDFYKENPGIVKLNTRSEDAALSSRVYGQSDWVEKRVVAIPHKGYKFMTVSLDIYEPSTTDIWLDDIEVSQSIEEFDDPRVKAPYSNYRIPDDILNGYSQGNL